MQIWIFQGAKSNFANGVFSSKANAEEWICKHQLSGILTLYPLDVGVYDWAIENGFFTTKKDYQTSPEFIQRFSSASQEHYHYQNGVCDD